jgi:hypothetical protein
MSTVANVRIWTISKSVQRSQGINTQGESAKRVRRQGLSKVCQCMREKCRD